MYTHGQRRAKTSREPGELSVVPLAYKIDKSQPSRPGEQEPNSHRVSGIERKREEQRLRDFEFMRAG
jgi:hypothetical protein